MTDRPPETTDAARVVLRAPNWLGDAVLALPAMAALRRHFAAARLTVAAPPGVAALFREETDVRPDEVLEVPDRPREATAAIAGGHFDVGVLFPNSFRSAWIMWRAGVRERWGYPRAGRAPLLTRRAASTRTPGVRHQADYFRALVRGLGVPCDEARPRVAARAAGRERADALLAPGGVRPAARLVALAPGAAYGEAKQWPPERYAALAARLIADHDAACVVVGAAHDRAASRAIESWLAVHAPAAAPRVVDLVGRTSLRTLCGVLAASDALVTNDSGAMHLAAALGRPVVAIFGPTDERATGPLGPHALLTASTFCRPCMLRDCPIDHRCMKRIAVETVSDAVAAWLAGAPPS